jgi:hypothetical protein
MAAPAAQRFDIGARVALKTPGGEVLRRGSVVELVQAGKTLHGYRIRWDDGATVLFAPSARGLEALEEENEGDE